MQKLIPSALLIIFTYIFTGCVHRTISNQPEYRGSAAAGQKYGSAKDDENIISKKRVWFWQDDFRNP